MCVFASDLDNTLIYSHRRPIGPDKVPVEWYEGREVSFMTKRSQEMLGRVFHKMTFVPVSTRSVEQYRRIRFDAGWHPALALVSNGGTLLVDGEEDAGWKEQSRRLINPAWGQLRLAQEILEKDPARTLDVRLVDGLFVFTKSDRVPETMARLRDRLDLSQVEVWENGSKVYVIPNRLNKGEAVRRLRERFSMRKVIAAGDSSFDFSLLKEADVAFYPSDLPYCGEKGQRHFAIDTQRVVFSDAILTWILENGMG